MKKITRITALILAVAMLTSMLSFVSFAGDSKSGRNICVTVETAKRPWYSLLPATVKITNTGRTPMTINVENSKGQLLRNKCLTSLKPGKSHTFSLSHNTTYYFYWSGNAMGGSIYADGTLTTGRHIKAIY
ncbi:MAG: hypothetical protein IJU78_09660 [Clostridia bacterium]|nr:hypothetical protein [Clostridia bacterium]